MKHILVIAILCATWNALAQQSNFRACVDSYNIDKLQPLRAKIMLQGRVVETPFPMLVDQSKATEEEKTAIAAFVENYNFCIKQDAAYLGSIPQEAAALIRANMSGLFGLAAGLYSGELTFGQFNKERMDRGAALQAGLSEVSRRHNDRAQAEEQARRNAALQYLLNQPRPTPIPSAQPYQIPIQPSVTTNCYRFGSQTTCTSR